jgi:hypothetical protein
MAKNAASCPDGFNGLVLFTIRDDEYDIQIYVPGEKKPLEDDSDFFHNLTEDGSKTGIDVPEYLNGIANRIYDFGLDKEGAAELITQRLNELKYLQSGGFLPEDVAFEIRDQRS